MRIKNIFYIFCLKSATKTKNFAKINAINVENMINVRVK